MIYSFADCTLDTTRHELVRAGAPVKIEPQVFELLTLLVSRAGDLVTKEELIEIVWKSLNISDSAISARINAARKAIGDTDKSNRLLQTVPRLGFRFAAEVTTDKVADTETETQRPEIKIEDHQVIAYTRSADGLSFGYAKSGEGPPLLKAGHWLSHLELDWHSNIWHSFLERLGQHFTLYRYDQRGTSFSEGDISHSSLGDFVGDIAAVADAAGLDRFPIYAPSQAAPIAIEYAALYPERVSKLILHGGYATGRLVRENLQGDIDEDAILSLIRNGWGKPQSAFMKAFSSLFLPDATAQQIDELVKIQLASASAETAVKLRQIVDGFDVRHRLSSLQVPTLVIHSRFDSVQPIEQGKLLASEIPNARFVMLDSPNHIQLPQTPTWEQLNQEIIRFLEED
ncbi:alpha/beta fold hydrolase [Sneathiella limimaris]|uniref:alpha/beta fold hydrolase n=1 Tax=Sneathiella limimaris TaxID=1964213 RepID=UPI00146F11B5|nr:alpha/beta fold hydrolase [Sneathiella limimaris]